MTWLGLRIGLTWVEGFVRDLLVGVLWGCPFPWGHGVSPSFFILLPMVFGGSGVLSHRANFVFFSVVVSLGTN